MHGAKLTNQPLRILPAHILLGRRDTKEGESFGTTFEDEIQCDIVIVEYQTQKFLQAGPLAIVSKGLLEVDGVFGFIRKGEG